MAAAITTRKAGGTWVVRAGGAVIGETKDAIELVEGDQSPVIYFPRGDIAMAFLEETDTTSNCPSKGDATYFSVHTKSNVIDDAAWSYQSPTDSVAEIAGHVAFNTKKVTVEEL